MEYFNLNLITEQTKCAINMFNIIIAWKKTTNIFAIIGPKELPVAISSICLYMIIIKLYSINTVINSIRNTKERQMTMVQRIIAYINDLMQDQMNKLMTLNEHRNLSLAIKRPFCIQLTKVSPWHNHIMFQYKMQENSQLILLY